MGEGTLNLPNKITLARIVLIPVFMVFMLSKVKYGDWVAAAVFIVAAATAAPSPAPWVDPHAEQTHEERRDPTTAHRPTTPAPHDTVLARALVVVDHLIVQARKS